MGLKVAAITRLAQEDVKVAAELKAWESMSLPK